MLDEAQIRATIPQAFTGVDLFNLGDRQSGKVRDFFTLDDGRRVLITTDRLSAFDRILTAVPYKGQVLNQLSAFWFERTADIVANHVIAIPDPNVTVAHECEPFEVEVVVRGYISGVTQTALWYRYSLGEREADHGRGAGEAQDTRSQRERLLTPIPTRPAQGILGPDPRGSGLPADDPVVHARHELRKRVHDMTVPGGVGLAPVKGGEAPHLDLGLRHREPRVLDQLGQADDAGARPDESQGLPIETDPASRRTMRSTSMR